MQGVTPSQKPQHSPRAATERAATERAATERAATERAAGEVVQGEEEGERSGQRIF